MTKQLKYREITQPPFWNDTELSRRDKAIRAAAFIDTEGTIRINQIVKAGQIVSYSANCFFTSISASLPQWMLDNFGGSIVRRMNTGNNAKIRYDWSVASKKAAKFLLEIYPFLMIKRPQADVAIELCKLQGYEYRSLSLQTKIEKWQPLWIEIKRLNQGQGEYK